MFVVACRSSRTDQRPESSASRPSGTSPKLNVVAKPEFEEFGDCDCEEKIYDLLARQVDGWLLLLRAGRRPERPLRDPNSGAAGSAPTPGCLGLSRELRGVGIRSAQRIGRQRPPSLHAYTVAVVLGSRPEGTCGSHNLLSPPSTGQPVEEALVAVKRSPE